MTNCNCDNCINAYLDRIDNGEIPKGTYVVVRGDGWCGGYYQRSA